jgi:3-dehydroquinate synthase
VVTVRVPIREERDASYDIHIGRGLLERLPRLLAEHCPAGAYAVLSDSHVGKLYGRTITAALCAGGAHAELLTFPAGEWNKTRETWAALSDRMLAHEFGRDAAVVALGGGVVGDVAGFVAATYLRGIPFVQIPTSLLAMIDSSIGGKTGVDAPAGKNLLGAFHQPRLVVADLDVLASLAPVQLAAGMAEALKHGVIADESYFELLEREHHAVMARDPVLLERVVARSVEIKADVVARDEREVGVRAVLNVGHTVAHAIEAVAKFESSHGEAVGIGMIVEARLGEALGVTRAGTAQRIAAALERYQLPLDVPAGVAPDQLLGAMRHDKKARGQVIRFALPAAIGAMHRDASGAFTVAAPEATIIAALESGSERGARPI